MKMMKRVGALLLALVMALSVSGCVSLKPKTDGQIESPTEQTGNTEAAEGVYNLFALSTYGFLAEKAAFGMESVVTLDEGGTGYMTVKEEGGDISSWVLNGENITVVSGVSTMEGMLKDGVLILDMGDETVAYYAKAGADTSGYEVMTAEEYYATGGAAGTLLAAGLEYYYAQNGKEFDRETALDYFTKAAAQGSGDAWYYLGKMNEQSLEKGHKKEAFNCYQKAAELGSPLGLYAQGRAYMYGIGVKKDYKKAQSLFQQAIALDCKEANRGLGEMYMYGYGVDIDAKQALTHFLAATEGKEFGLSHISETFIGDLYYYGLLEGEPDFNTALEWYQKAADAGDDNGYESIGWAYFEGNGVPQDYAEAKQYFEKAASLGSVDAMRAIGNLYYKGNGVKKDYATALEWYEKAASLGDPTSCKNIADMYQYGDGTKADPEKAIQWYLKAAQEGDTSVYSYIADLYHFDESGIKNEKEALKYYKKAAKTGSAYATARIGSFYYWGYGDTKINYKKAVKYFKKAANAGNATGLYYLGTAYYSGKGVKQNYKESAKWYKKAAKKKHPHAMKTLGYQYYKGLGVKKNLKTAKKWLNKALKTKQLDKGNTNEIKKWLKDINKKVK